LKAVSISISAAKMSRRVAATAALALTVAGLLALTATGSFAQKKQGPTEVPVEELMKPGDLPDVTLGATDAKITVVEYASLTCPHCAHFETKVFPEFKTKYIDTGKVKYIFRGFALNPLDTAAQMLVQCLDADKRQAMTEAFYDKQADWAFVEGNPVPKLFEMSKQAGFTQETFDKCLKDQPLLDKINAVRTRASDTFGVNATPTFFINGKKLTETPTIEAFNKVLDPLLAAK
jgi:protein-disulfide isomerase